jgi:trehalose 6-phosphate phosphatase
LPNRASVITRLDAAKKQSNDLVLPNMLAKRHLPKLSEFAFSNVLLAFDFDGTLAPIVANPLDARMRPRTRRLLGAVARRYPCVVISGRGRSDVLKRVGSVPVWQVSGNHGLEPWAQNATYPSQVQNWVRRLDRALGRLPGVFIENKTYSVTVHYRQARNKRAALAAIKDAVRGMHDARVLGGKHALSLIPRGAPNKGAALERARRLLACDTAIYVGDDDTDEDAFAAGRPDTLLGIRIGLRGASQAQYGLKSQEDIDEFLQALLDRRPLRM